MQLVEVDDEGEGYEVEDDFFDRGLRLRRLTTRTLRRPAGPLVAERGWLDLQRRMPRYPPPMPLPLMRGRQQLCALAVMQAGRVTMVGRVFEA